MNKTPKPLMIYEEIFKSLKEKHRIEKPDISFTKWATEYILANLKKEEFILQYAPHLELISADEKSILLRDNHLDGKIAEVTLRDNRLWCSECKPKTCMHVFYAMGRVEVANLIDLDGKK